jgi:hypothetical protein
MTKGPPKTRHPQLDWGPFALDAVANKEGGFGRFPIELGMTGLKLGVTELACNESYGNLH